NRGANRVSNQYHPSISTVSLSENALQRPRPRQRDRVRCPRQEWTTRTAHQLAQCERSPPGDKSDSLADSTGAQRTVYLPQSCESIGRMGRTDRETTQLERPSVARASRTE